MNPNDANKRRHREANTSRFISPRTQYNHNQTQKRKNAESARGVFQRVESPASTHVDALALTLCSNIQPSVGSSIPTVISGPVEDVSVMTQEEEVHHDLLSGFSIIPSQPHGEMTFRKEVLYTSLKETFFHRWFVPGGTMMITHKFVYYNYRQRIAHWLSGSMHNYFSYYGRLQVYICVELYDWLTIEYGGSIVTERLLNGMVDSLRRYKQKDKILFKVALDTIYVLYQHFMHQVWMRRNIVVGRNAERPIIM